MRALAVSLVVLNHAFPAVLAGGYVGVDAFFVISGYLMTGILLRSASEPGVREGRLLADFYSRRAKRLLPAAALVLCVTAVSSVVLLPPLRLVGVGWEIVTSALYSQNWMLAYNGTDYLNMDKAPSPVQHYWSLAVEEQFYLAWPLLFMVALVLQRRLRRPLLRTVVITGIAVTLATSLAWCVIYTAIAPQRAYFSTLTRGWELALGGLLAVFPSAAAALAGRRRAPWLAAAGLMLIIVSASLFDTSTVFPGYAALLPALGSALVLVAGCGPPGGHPGLIGRVMALRPFQVLGDLSYSLYLWHWPVLVLLAARGLDGPVASAGGVAASCLLAYVTFVAVEERSRSSYSMTMFPRRALNLGAVLAVVATVAGLLVVLRYPKTPAARSNAEIVAAGELARRAGGATAVAHGAEVLRAEPRDDPVGLPVDTGDLVAGPDQARSFMGCPVGYDTDQVESCAFGDPAGRRTVMLVGDSHAQQWIPPLDQIAARNGLRLDVYTKQLCLFMDGQLDRAVAHRELDRTCLSWNRAVMDRIRSIKPAAVFTSNYVLKGSDAIGVQLGERYSEVNKLGIPLISISDTPVPGIDVPDCISRNPRRMSECAVPRDEAMRYSGVAQRRAVRGLTKTHLIDLNDAICPTVKCAAVIGGVIVYVDTNHLSNLYALSLRDRLEQKIRAAEPGLLSKAPQPAALGGKDQTAPTPVPTG